MAAFLAVPHHPRHQAALCRQAWRWCCVLWSPTPLALRCHQRCCLLQSGGRHLRRWQPPQSGRLHRRPQQKGAADHRWRRATSAERRFNLTLPLQKRQQLLQLQQQMLQQVRQQPWQQQRALDLALQLLLTAALTWVRQSQGRQQPLHHPQHQRQQAHCSSNRWRAHRPGVQTQRSCSLRQEDPSGLTGFPARRP